MRESIYEEKTNKGLLRNLVFLKHPNDVIFFFFVYIYAVVCDCRCYM